MCSRPPRPSRPLSGSSSSRTDAAVASSWGKPMLAGDYRDNLERSVRRPSERGNGSSRFCALQECDPGTQHRHREQPATGCRVEPRVVLGKSRVTHAHEPMATPRHIRRAFFSRPTQRPEARHEVLRRKFDPQSKEMPFRPPTTGGASASYIDSSPFNCAMAGR